MNDDQATVATLGTLIRSGTRAVLAAQLVAQLVSFAALAYLYRRLGPSPFGLMGMALPALMLARMLAGFGLQEGVIQSRVLGDDERDRVFWMNQLTGLAAAAVMLCCGPILSWLFGSRDLVPLCAALALTLPLTTLGAVHQGWLQRQMAIPTLMKLRVVAQVAGAAAACVAAWQGSGVWSLVVQQWVELALLAALLWLASDWRPTWKGLGWQANLFHFGGWYTGASFCFYWAQNVDKYLLAWLLGATPAGRAAIGMYSQAYNLALKPVALITSPASGIVLPSLARLRDDADRFSRFTIVVWSMLTAMLAPAAVGVAIVAPDIMTLLGGGPWFSAAPMLIALSPLILAQGLINICGSVLAAKGKARPLCQGAAAQVLLLSAVACGVAWQAIQAHWTPQQSAFSMAVAIGTTTSGLILIPYLIYCARVTTISLRSFAAEQLPTLGASTVMGICVWALRGAWEYKVPPSLSLVGSASAGILVYGILMRHRLMAAWKQWRSTEEI